MTIPTRQPDFYLNLWDYKFNGWQESDHFVIVLNLKNGEQATMSELGNYDPENKTQYGELLFTVARMLVDKYVIK